MSLDQNCKLREKTSFEENARSVAWRRKKLYYRRRVRTSDTRKGCSIFNFFFTVVKSLIYETNFSLRQ